MIYKNFYHSTAIQLRFKDVDKQGHVNNANHLTYAETARVNYFADVLGRNIDWDETGILLARTEIDYKQPIFLSDEIFCFSKVTEIGTKSFVMTFVLAKKSGIEIIECAIGKCTLVCYNYPSRTTIQIPEKWRSEFKVFEKI